MAATLAKGNQIMKENWILRLYETSKYGLYEKVTVRTGFKTFTVRTGCKTFTVRTGCKTFTVRTGYKTFTVRTGYTTFTVRTGYTTFTVKTGYTTFTVRTGYKTFTVRTGYKPFNIDVMEGLVIMESVYKLGGWQVKKRKKWSLMILRRCSGEKV